MPDCDSARERVAWVCKCLGDADPAVQDAPWVKPLWEGVRMLAEALPPSIAGQASQASSDAFFDLENRLDLLSRHFEVMQRASALGVPRFLVAPLSRVLNAYLGEWAPDGGASIVLVSWFQGRNYCTDNGALCRELADLLDVYLNNDGGGASSALEQLRRMVIVACPFGSQDSTMLHALLAHELGHYALSRLPIARGPRTERLVRLPTRQREHAVPVEWVEELLCDITATHMLGPAPVLALRHSILPQLGAPSHPPAELRVEACRRVLAAQGYLAKDAPPDPAQEHLAALVGDADQESLGRHPQVVERLDEWVETIGGLGLPGLRRSATEEGVLERPEPPDPLLGALLEHVPPLPTTREDDVAQALSAIWLVGWVVSLDRSPGGLWERFSSPFADHPTWGGVRAQAALSNILAKAIELLPQGTEVAQ